MSKQQNWQQERQAIIDALDVRAEYESLGVRFTSDTPRENGFLECHAVGREDNSPSACVNVKTGLYVDKGGSGEKCSLWDFAAKYGNAGHKDWQAARKFYADKAGVKLSGGRTPKRPDEELEWLPWKDPIAALWCRHKLGVTLEAVKLSGARLATYAKGKFMVLAFPVYLPPQFAAVEPAAYVIMQTNGKDLPKWKKGGKGAVEKWLRHKSICENSGGLMNAHAMERLANPTPDMLVWKVEGVSDMLALQGFIPPEYRDKHLVVCNAGGATEDLQSATAMCFAGLRTAIIHDADHAGEAGATKWLHGLAPLALSPRHVRLPYEIVPNHGKDLRDWINEGHTYAELIQMAKDATPLPTGQPEENGHAVGTNGEANIETVFEEACLKTIGLEVLGELENGGVKVFTGFHRKIEEIREVGKLTYTRMLQIAGPAVKASVWKDDSEAPPGMHKPSDVRNAISLLAGYRRLGDGREIGVGCWGGLDDRGHPVPTVVLVGGGEGAVWDGRTFTKLEHPRCGGRLLDFSSSDSWYDFEQLSKYLAECDHAWAVRTMNEAIALFARWRWRHQTAAPIVMAGLVLASWVQTIWEWRPQVSVIGASQTGKSTLFSALDQIFGGLSIKSSQSSAAGIRQSVRTSARVIMCDEFEKSANRSDILDMLRASGRGDKILRGTPGQKGTEYGLRHVVWTAAIESGLRRAPDRNRFIGLELVSAGQDHGKLTLPSSGVLYDLGQRLLAVAIKYVQQAKPLAVRLKARRIEGIDDRIVESYAVPAALLATLQGEGPEDAGRLMEDMLSGIEREEKPSDERDLIRDILGEQVHTGRQTLTVAQLLEIVINNGPTADDCHMALEKVGVKLDRFGDSDPVTLHGLKCVVLAYNAISDQLLKKTRWAEHAIHEILRRLPEGIVSRRRVGGKRERVIIFSLPYFKNEFLGGDDQKEIDLREF